LRRDRSTSRRLALWIIKAAIVKLNQGKRLLVRRFRDHNERSGGQPNRLTSAIWFVRMLLTSMSALGQKRTFSDI
jgi:hypothetical protein